MEQDRQVEDRFQVAHEGPGRLHPRPLRAVHVERKAEDEAADRVLQAEVAQTPGIRRELHRRIVSSGEAMRRCTSERASPIVFVPRSTPIRRAPPRDASAKARCRRFERPGGYPADHVPALRGFGPRAPAPPPRSPRTRRAGARPPRRGRCARPRPAGAGTGHPGSRPRSAPSRGRAPEARCRIRARPRRPRTGSGRRRSRRRSRPVEHARSSPSTARAGGVSSKADRRLDAVADQLGAHDEVGGRVGQGRGHPHAAAREPGPARPAEAPVGFGQGEASSRSARAISASSDGQPWRSSAKTSAHIRSPSPVRPQPLTLRAVRRGAGWHGSGIGTLTSR